VTWAALPFLRSRLGWLRAMHAVLLSVAAAFAVWLRLK
jgi:hypothetical protein